MCGVNKLQMQELLDDMACNKRMKGEGLHTQVIMAICAISKVQIHIGLAVPAVAGWHDLQQAVEQMTEALQSQFTVALCGISNAQMQMKDWQVKELLDIMVCIKRLNIEALQIRLRWPCVESAKCRCTWKIGSSSSC